jgi:acyl-CoA dehydrogenase
MPSSPIQASRYQAAKRSADIARDCRGLNYFDLDPSLRDLLGVYMDDELYAHLEPHFKRLGDLAGGRLGEASMTAERHVPVLHPRDQFGRDEEWVEYHPAFREMESIAYAEFGLHAMEHRPGVLGWPAPLPPLAKHAFHYLFAQAEFGLLCPVNLVDSCWAAIERFGSDELRDRYRDTMLSQDMDTLERGGQFLTEKRFGTDLGPSDLTAVRDENHWRLFGEKWFCSSVDADVVIMLARPEGAKDDHSGLGLFLMPKTLADGSRNAYRIVRLKDKLGTRTMATGEVVLDGAVAYQLGELDQGIKQILVSINATRLSHLNRAAGMMRRCLNEALRTTSDRHTYGVPVIEHPLMRRQLMKLMVPAEQALSAVMFGASALGSEDDPRMNALLRVFTPIAKYRASRDNATVATGALEARGGNGYIEEWPNSRLVRDAHIGLLWEGTSNISSIDAIRRAVGKDRAHIPLAEVLGERLDNAPGIPEAFRARLDDALARALDFAAKVAGKPENERFSRLAAGALYHASTAILMASEGAAIAETRGDARRLLLARFVLDHRLDRPSPMQITGLEWEEPAIDLLLGEAPVTLDAAASLVADTGGEDA